MPSFKRTVFAAAATAALVCAPITPAAAAGPLLIVPWAVGHVVAGLARFATAAVTASVASAIYPQAPYASAYSPPPGYSPQPVYSPQPGYSSAPGYYPLAGYYPQTGYSGGYYSSARPRYYGPTPNYAPRSYYAPPRYPVAPHYYAPRSYAAPPAYHSPARYYSGPGYRPAPWYGRGSYGQSRSYPGRAMRYSGAHGAQLPYRGFSHRRR